MFNIIQHSIHLITHTQLHIHYTNVQRIQTLQIHTSTGFLNLITAISIFFEPESTTSISALIVNLIVLSSDKSEFQDFSKNSLTAFSLRPPIALA